MKEILSIYSQSLTVLWVLCVLSLSPSFCTDRVPDEGLFPYNAKSCNDSLIDRRLMSPSVCVCVTVLCSCVCVILLYPNRSRTGRRFAFSNANHGHERIHIDVAIDILFAVLSVVFCLLSCVWFACL